MKGEECRSSLWKSKPLPGISSSELAAARSRGYSAFRLYFPIVAGVIF